MFDFRTAIVCAGLALAAHGQTLSPREVFYGQGRADAAKPAVKKRAPAAAVPGVRKSSTAPSVAAADEPANPPAEPLRTDIKPMVVEYAGAKTGPLGIRYSVKKLESSGDFVEVDADTAFHSGDRIALVIESNDTGYLYVIHQGSSGRWETMYPADQKTEGSNRVERGRVYRIPSEDGVFSFDEKVGTEKLFVVLTREPERDLEKLIYSLQDRKPDTGEAPKMIMAQNIQDELVQRLRNAYTRDLVIEKVDDSRPSPAARSKAIPPERMGEKAVYVVNPKAGPGARVVADIQLRHQ